MLKLIERVISRRLNRFPSLKRYVKQLYTFPFMCIGKYARRPSVPENVVLFGQPNCESFFGYYDVCPENASGLVLCHQTTSSTSLEPNPKVPIDICVFSLERPDEPLLKTNTSAFNWQQGSRLQWLNDDRFIFNDFDPQKNRYIAKIWDIKIGEQIKVVGKPIQALIDEANYLSLNYQRLAKLRPDYGYFNLDPNNCDLSEYHQDGIWTVNIDTGKHKLLYSLASIISHDASEDFSKYEHKLNHLMLSPNKDKFIILHRMFDGQRRIGRLLLGDIDGGILKTLPGDEMVSHYCWVNDNTIICYMNTGTEGYGYYLINLDSNNADLLKSTTSLLPGDGHPSYKNGECFLTDSYPDRYGYQNLYLCSLLTEKVTMLASLFHPRQYKGVTRCDLHPRFGYNCNSVYFDSVNDGVRRLHMISLTKNDLYN